MTDEVTDLFVVVHCLDDNTVCTISSSWLVGKGRCRWPQTNVKSEYRAKLLAHEKPSDDWFTYNIIQMGSYDNFLVALEKEDRAAFTSGIDTDKGNPAAEKEKSRKRRRKKTQYAEEIVQPRSSSEDEAMPSVKTLQNVTATLPPPVTVDFEDNDQLLPPSFAASRHDDFTPQACSSKIGSLSFTNEPFSTLDLVVAEKEPTPWQKELLLSIQRLHALTLENNKLLKALQPVSQCNRTLLEQQMPKLPIACIKEFDEWETYLNDPVKFCKCVQYFESEVGFEASVGCRRILAQILTNSFAQNFNWNGRPPKRPFKHSATVKLILCAIKENSYTKDVPSKQTEDTIKDWLKHASYRENYNTKKNVNKCK